MHDYREEALPLALESVGPGEPEAAVRVLYHSTPEPVRVAPGQAIADTRYEVVEVRRVITRSKQGKGEAVDVSQMVIRDRETGEPHLVVKGVPARSSKAFAVMSVGRGNLYDVRRDDEFELAGTNRSTYRVIDVRPTQIVIENRETGEIVTVQRFGNLSSR